MGISFSELIVVVIVVLAVFRPDTLKELIQKIKPALQEINESREQLKETVQPAKDIVNDLKETVDLKVDNSEAGETKTERE